MEEQLMPALQGLINVLIGCVALVIAGLLSSPPRLLSSGWLMFCISFAIVFASYRLGLAYYSVVATDICYRDTAVNLIFNLQLIAILLVGGFALWRYRASLHAEEEHG